MWSLACFVGLFVSLGGTGGPFWAAGLEELLEMPLDTAEPEALFVKGLVEPRCHAVGVAGFLEEEEGPC